MTRVTPALLDLFRRRGLHHRFGGGDRWQAGETLSIPKDCQIEPHSHLFAGHDLPRRLGAFTYALSNLTPNVSLGRYGSIAGNVEFITSEHPTDWVTSSPFPYSPYGLEGVRDYLVGKGLTSFPLHPAARFLPQPIVIGHDVWVGQGAMFMGGVRVGDGAVIAARAVVTADVPPHAIVGGAPARVIRMRFPEDLSARLLGLAWWRFGPDVLQPLDVREPERFADRLEALLAESPPAPFDPPPITYPEIAATQAPA